MVADDTGLRYIDEVDLKCLFVVGEELQCAKNLIESQDGFVLHCPTLARWVHELPQDNIAVVFMRRDVTDVQRSQDRIKWKKSRQEIEYQRYGLTKFNNYRNKIPQRQSSGLRRTTKSIAEIKYEYWDKVQKDQVKNCFEINYLDLRNHPMWVDRSQRANFRWNQIRPKGDAQAP